MKNTTTSMMLLVPTLAVWTMIALPNCHGLCPTRLVSCPTLSSSLRMTAVGMNGNADGDIARSRQRDREVRTLYDYLGASPKDSQEQLKIRYTTLAKKLHPDSNPDGDVEYLYYDLSEINAAWEVLKDPKERKKYDRSLQTKEIIKGIDSSVSKGLEFFSTTAIPFMQKTAVTTQAAMDLSAKTAKEVNEQATKAYGQFEVEQQIKALEQKSNADLAKAQKLQKEINALPTKKIEILEKKPLQAKQQALSSIEAQKILTNFKATSHTMKVTPMSLSKEIAALKDTENKEKDATRVLQSTERELQMTSRKVEQAMKAEEAAQKKLEEAQKALKEAQQLFMKAQEVDRKAKLEEKTAQQNSAKIETQLQKTRERVRVGLHQQQDAYLMCRTNELKKEKQECEKSSQKYLQQVKELKAKTKKER